MLGFRRRFFEKT